MLDINKQEMKYSLQTGKIPKYETDSKGNVVATIVDGVEQPKKTGEYVTGYSDPVIFYANISNKLSESLIKDFGVDDSTNFSQIVTGKGEIPLDVGSLIWKRSEVRYLDPDKTQPDPKSCDYIVKGIADEGIEVDLFLLQKNVK